MMQVESSCIYIFYIIFIFANIDNVKYYPCVNMEQGLNPSQSFLHLTFTQRDPLFK